LFFALQKDFAKKGITLVAIGFETEGLEEFISHGYWMNDHVYLDFDRKLYAAMGLRRLGLMDGFGLLKGDLYSLGSTANSLGFQGNLRGDGFQLGGTVLIGKDTKTGQLSTLFEFRQTFLGELTPYQPLLKVIGASDERIKEVEESVAEFTHDTVVQCNKGGC